MRRVGQTRLAALKAVRLYGIFEGGAGADETVFDTILKPIAAITHATLITYARAGSGGSDLDSSNHILEKHGILQDIEGL
jgi:hypothetical protein